MPVTLLIGLAMLVLQGTTVAGTAGAASTSPRIIEHGSRDSKQVALTFDACPTGRDDEYDERVIDVLIAGKVPATLFLSGRWVERNAERTAWLAAQPQFEIGNHAYWHPHLLEKDDGRVLRELKRTQSIIRKTAGVRPKFFRPPYGEVDERVAAIAQKAGLTTIQYDVASGDPDPGLSAKRIIRAVTGEAKGGSIVVLHMNRNGMRTADVLPEIIKGLREKGYELVTVGEMLKEQTPSSRGRTQARRAATKQNRDEADPTSSAPATTVSSTVSSERPTILLIPATAGSRSSDTVAVSGAAK